MHSRVLIVHNIDEKPEQIIIDEDYIYNALAGRLGVDGLSMDTNLKEDLQWVKESLDFAFEEPDIINIGKLESHYMTKLGQSDSKNIPAVVLALVDQFKQHTFVYGIVDERGFVEPFTLEDVLKDYGYYLLNQFHTIPWEKDNLRYKIMDTLDIHL